MIYYGSKNYNVGETTIHFKSKLSNIKTKYIYYYLLYNKSILEQNYYGLNQKSITDDDLFKIEISIPSIEIQNKKVENIDKLEASIETIKLRSEQIKHEQYYILNSIISTEYNEIERIEFGQMFDLIKGTIQSSKVVEDINGDGVFINLSKNKEFKKIKDFDIDNENIFISNVSPLGLIQYYNGKCCYSNLLYHIKIKDNYKINIKYIYYYLLEKQNYIEENYQLGCANKSLDVEEFNLMKIPIPSIEKQKEIVDILDGINNRINEDIKYIEVLRKLISKSI